MHISHLILLSDMPGSDFGKNKKVNQMVCLSKINLNEKCSDLKKEHHHSICHGSVYGFVKYVLLYPFGSPCVIV